jgi:tRNA threonylcarbamoyladenosine biosynthesis protein TsaE
MTTKTIASPAARALLLPDASATENAGRALAPHLTGGMLVTLEGELGAGKTTFARGVLRGLGWQGPVKSPTYTLVEHYPFSSLYLYHFDFYRFADPSEWETAGFSEYFRPDAIDLVEWPSKAADRLPPPSLAVHLTFALPAQGRRLHLTAGDAPGRAALQALTAALR